MKVSRLPHHLPPIHFLFDAWRNKSQPENVRRTPEVKTQLQKKNLFIIIIIISHLFLPVLFFSLFDFAALLHCFFSTSLSLTQTPPLSFHSTSFIHTLPFNAFFANGKYTHATHNTTTTAADACMQPAGQACV